MKPALPFSPDFISSICNPLSGDLLLSRGQAGYESLVGSCEREELLGLLGVDCARLRESILTGPQGGSVSPFRWQTKDLRITIDKGPDPSDQTPSRGS